MEPHDYKRVLCLPVCCRLYSPYDQLTDWANPLLSRVVSLFFSGEVGPGEDRSSVSGRDWSMPVVQLPYSSWLIG